MPTWRSTMRRCARSINFRLGLPGRSNAFAIAQRLGMPIEILDTAKGYLDRNVARAEDMLAEIAKLQQQNERALESAQKSQREAEANADRIRLRLNSIEDERKQLLDAAKEDALRQTEQLRAEVRRLRNRIVSLGGTLDEVKQIEQETERAIEQAQQQQPTKSIRHEPMSRRAIAVGDTVRVKTLNATAEVGAIIGNEADVQMGRMRMRVRLSDLERVRAARQEPAVDDTRVNYVDRGPAPSMELDLRGMNIEDSLPRVEDYLDRAARTGMPFVRIIHGKGTGVLRRAIRDAIKNNRVVKSFETGLEGEGGDGVTVVKLQSN